MLLAHTREKKIFLSRALPKIAFFRGRIRKLFTCSRDSLQLCASSFFFPPDSPLSPTLALTDLRTQKGLQNSRTPANQPGGKSSTHFFFFATTLHHTRTRYTSFFGSDFPPFPRTHDALRAVGRPPAAGKHTPRSDFSLFRHNGTSWNAPNPEKPLVTVSERAVYLTLVVQKLRPSRRLRRRRRPSTKREASKMLNLFRLRRCRRCVMADSRALSSSL